MHCHNFLRFILCFRVLFCLLRMFHCFKPTSILFFFFFFAPVSSFTLSPTKLLIGTYDGKILLCDTEKLLNNESTVQTFSSQPVKELRGHWFAVYSLLCVKGHISTDGTTSFFPTFIGKPNESLPQEFLVSIGFGKGHKELAKIFKGSVAKEGTYINTWLL